MRKLGRNSSIQWSVCCCLPKVSFALHITMLGVVLTRKLPKLPKRKCWFIGQSRLDAVDAANRFNENWQTDLRIGHHDCRNYTNGNDEYFIRDM